MKTSLALKTLFRTVGKTIFTFLLIAVLTFSLFIQVAEYQATAREFAANVDMYHGTGYVEKTPPAYTGYSMLKYPYYIETDPRVDAVDIPELNEFKYPSLKGEELEAVAALPYVSSTYQRYMTAGRSDLLRLQDDYEIWDINARAVIEGTLVGPCMNITNVVDAAYRLTDCKVLAGDLDIKDFTIGDGTTYFVASPVERGWMPDYIGEDWVPTASDRDNNYDQLSLLLGWDCIHVKLKNYRYGATAQASWIPGGRYVFVFRFYRVSCERRGLSLYLYDWVSEHFCPSVWDVTDAPENYLEREEYAPLKKLVDITNSDLKTLDVVYTDDMAAIRQVNEGKIVLREGRWITPEDTATDAKVCMVERVFAETHRLKVGDTLPLELGDVLFEQMLTQGAVASTEERYADNWTPETFEIVGLYTAPSSFSRSKEPNWSYSVNTVFVPLSSLPSTAATDGWEFAPGEFTFRVDNAWDIAPFLEETAPKIEEMGLTLMFDDGGWMEVYKPYKQAQRIALLRIGVLAAVTVMATAFVVYLFISRKKKDYAIMRALGTPKRQSGAALLLPLMVLAVVSVILGLTAAMLYIGSMGKLEQPPLGMALLCGLAELVIALFLALGMLRSLSRQSPLALLQGGTRTRAAAQPAPQQGNMAQTAVVGPAAASPQAAPQPVTPLTQERRRKPRPLRFVLRYIFRHIRRSAVKSLLSVLVAALMLSAVAQLGYMRMSYDRLKIDTLVTAAFNRSITLPKLKQIEEAGLTADLYYERNLEAVVVIDADTYAAKLALTPDIARYTGMPCTITYAEGHGVEDLRVTGKYAVLGKALMEACGLSLGDKVRIAKEAALFQFMTEQMSRAVYEHPGELVTRQTLFILDREYMEQALDDFCDCLTIIGSVETGNTTFDNMIYAPGMEADKQYKYDTILEYAEFHLPDNARAQEMKQIGEELTHKRSGEFSIDIEKLESVERTAALLETLYPIVIALTLVIGAFLCVLIIMQTVKDAAIMRIQGTTKAMTRAMLAVEQILLAVFGVAIGLGVMAAVHRTDFATIAKPTLRFGGAYLAIAAAASVVSAALATKKNLLELLQTKE